MLSKAQRLQKLAETLKLTPEQANTLPSTVTDRLLEVLTQGESWEVTRTLVQDAIRDRLNLTDDSRWEAWVRDIYNGNQAIYEYDGKCWQIGFTVSTTDGSQSVALTEAIEVQVAYMPVGESRRAPLEVAFVPLVEKAIRGDGTFPIKLIAPGKGSSGYYAPDVLERDAGVFAAGTHMYFDHPTESEQVERPERSVKDLAATLATDAAWDADGPAGPGIYAEAKVIDAYRPFIEELAPHVGLSIRAAGEVAWGEAEGATGPIVKRIVSAESVDLVTKPGAGGQFLPLYESARKRLQERQEPQEADMDPKKLAELEEAQTKSAAEITKLQEENARMREATILREAHDIASARLRETTLPEITQTRLAPQLAAKVPLKEGAIDREAYDTAIEEAAKAEAEYLSKVGAGRITGLGESHEVELDGEKADEALSEAFGRMGLNEKETKVAVAGR